MTMVAKTKTKTKQQKPLKLKDRLEGQKAQKIEPLKSRLKKNPRMTSLNQNDHEEDQENRISPRLSRERNGQEEDQRNGHQSKNKQAQSDQGDDPRKIQTLFPLKKRKLNKNEQKHPQSTQKHERLLAHSPFTFN